MRKLNSSFVSAEPPTGELDPLMEQSLTQNMERDVLVPAMQNLLGGLGVFMLAAVFQFWRIDSGASTSTTIDATVFAAYLGGGAFALACIWRAFKDEVQMFSYHWSRGWSEGRTNQELDYFVGECERLQVENRQLRTSNANMVRHVKVTTGRDELPNPAPRMAEDEYTEPLRDALALCRYQDAHGKISRDDVVAAGVMERPRWGSARQLLIDSGVQVQNGVIATSSAQAMALVRDFVDKQRRQPNDFVAPFEQ